MADRSTAVTLIIDRLAREGFMLKLVDEHFEEAFTVALMAVMTFLIGIQIFMRYVMGASLSWSEELARYLFIWMTYTGVAYAIRKNAHIRVTMFADLLPAQGQIYLRILTHAIFAAFVCYAMYQGWFLIEKTFRFGQKSASLGMPMAFVYLAPFTGFVMVLVRLAQSIFCAVRNGTEREMQ
jgi:TRAP-type C4-dicarboxylate transport system permease small subunit